ncbi:phage tail tube protein [Marinobacter sp. OP 3.4]|uniref:phage tail tube protein n=1 Tax=Marinobacter sp. OP 3.4 TaxID=3076501 RepID=UPI002E1D17C8
MKITGNVTVREGGEELLTDGKGTLNPGGFEREAKMNGRRTVGFSENPVAPTLSIVIHHTQDTDIVRLSNLTDATILLETDSGQTWMLRGAFCASPTPLDMGAGTVQLEMSGLALERV